MWEEAIAAFCAARICCWPDPSHRKNVLAENLAAVFGRPMWNVSFHINMDATGMLGTDTFKTGKWNSSRTGVPVRGERGIRGLR